MNDILNDSNKDYLEAETGIENSSFSATQARKDFLGGSGTEAKTSEQLPLLTPDLLGLIHGYGHPEDEGQEIPVGITRFQMGKKILDFVTAQHTGNLQDSTHRTVKEAITTRNPQVVITEGHATDMSDEVRSGIIQWTKGEVEKVRENNNIQNPNMYIPEAGYAAYLAKECGIPSVGGEISGNEFLTKMQSHGYSLEDVLADSFMRQIETLPLKDRLTMTEEEFMTNHMERLLAKANQRVNPQRLDNIEPLTIDQFKQWYITHPLSGNRSFRSINHEDFVPRQQGEFTQKMACASGLVRDEHIAELFNELFKQNDHVAIVYGAGHLNSLRPLLENMFDGEGNFTRIGLPGQELSAK